jgi:hypothetical protein
MKDFLGACLLGALLGLMIGYGVPAKAQAIYGPQGQYLGTAQTTGSTTQFYGAAGQYQGSAQTNNGQTSFYGATGNYQGVVTAPMYQPTPQPSVQNVPNVPQVPTVRGW